MSDKKLIQNVFGLPNIQLMKIAHISCIFSIKFAVFTEYGKTSIQTSSTKGNDAYLRAIIQSEKKWKHQFFRRLRAANSVVLGRIWPNFKLIQACMYVIITCKYEKDPIKNNLENGATPYFRL